MPFMVEQVGYDPTPSDFQSAAMTTSATDPLVIICGGIRVRFGNGRMQICNDNQFHHTPNKKLTHSFMNCVSLIALYFYLVYL